MDFSQPEILKTLRSVGFSNKLLGDLGSCTCSPSKASAVDKVIELGEKLVLCPPFITQQSSAAVDDHGRPCLQKVPNKAIEAGSVDNLMDIDPVDFGSKRKIPESLQGTPSHLFNPSKRISVSSAGTSQTPITPVLQASPGGCTRLTPGYREKKNGAEDVTDQPDTDITRNPEMDIPETVDLHLSEDEQEQCQVPDPVVAEEVQKTTRTADAQTDCHLGGLKQVQEDEERVDVSGTGCENQLNHGQPSVGERQCASRLASQIYWENLS